MPTRPDSRAFVLKPSLLLRYAYPMMHLPVLGFVLWMSYRAGRVPAQAPFFLFAPLITPALLWRRRLEIRDGRIVRGSGGAAAVDLTRLQSVSYRLLTGREGRGFVVEITDTHGQTARIKPSAWEAGGADFIAIVKACVDAQRIEADSKTRDYLARLAQKRKKSVPTWAMRMSSVFPSVEPTPPRKSFWLRRDADGVARRMRPQGIVALVALIVLCVPVGIWTSSVSTSALLSLKCRNVQATDASAGLTSANLDQVTADVLVAVDRYGMNVGGLTPAEIAPVDDAPKALQRDASLLVDGRRLQALQDYAFVQIEDFGTHTNAMAFQRDWVTGHCRGGDAAFDVSLPGAIGFRCGCINLKDDKIGFVRGQYRFQVGVQGLDPKADHSLATALATAVAGAATKTTAL